MFVYLFLILKYKKKKKIHTIYIKNELAAIVSQRFEMANKKKVSVVEVRGCRRRYTK